MHRSAFVFVLVEGMHMSAFVFVEVVGVDMSVFVFVAYRMLPPRTLPTNPG